MSISKKRLTEIAAMPDAAIDSSDIPEIDARSFDTARPVTPSGTARTPVSLRIDAVFDRFKAQGKGHPSRMNGVPRACMLAHDGDPSRQACKPLPHVKAGGAGATGDAVRSRKHLRKWIGRRAGP